jgi:hypothetical protein
MTREKRLQASPSHGESAQNCSELQAPSFVFAEPIQNPKSKIQNRVTKLAIVTSHPIQYYAPWFRHLAAMGELDLKVFYLWDFGAVERIDVGFQ